MTIELDRDGTGIVITAHEGEAAAQVYAAVEEYERMENRVYGTVFTIDDRPEAVKEMEGWFSG